MIEFFTQYQAQIIFYIVPLAYAFGSLLLGLIFEKLIIKKLKNLAHKTRFKSGEVIFNALQGTILLLFVTAGFYFALRNLIVDTEALAFIKKILVVIIIGAITMVASKIALGFIHLHAGKIRGVFSSTSIFGNITNVIIFIVGTLIGLQTFGISITPILTALGVGGLAVALALQDTLSNLFSGLHIIASRQVRPGDYVRIDSGEEGFISDITWRNTAIRSLSNNMIIVPNSKMASSIVTNYSQPSNELSIVVPLHVSYDNDMEKVQKIVMEVAKETMEKTPGGLPDFQPSLRFQELADNGIHLNVILRGKEYIDQYFIKHEFLKKISDRFKREEVHITVPAKPIIMNSWSQNS